MSERRGRVGILISGRGSNMVALVQAMQAGAVPADPVVVISNEPDAPGLEAARGLGVATDVVDHRRVRPREVHERAVVEILRHQDVELVCLAGYMRLLSPYLVSEFRNRILNVHPALLPAFPGLHAQAQALEYGAAITGCTVHFVDEQCDHGPIILQAAVPVEPDDTVDDLSARILEQEHRLYPQAVKLYFEDRLRIEDRRVRIRAPS